MKKITVLIAGVTMILLFVTKSLYVEWTELIIIIGSLSSLSIRYNLFSKRQRGVSYILGSSALFGFLFYWVLSLIDLIVDHFMYDLPTGNEDGQPLSLGNKIQEYNDDLFVGSVLSLLSVIVITFVYSRITLKKT
ncbi:hypothetical protein ASG89_30845 [Paenibacillus sp. Soil766]|uniref:hypothetical protein n=1 Tax=Paenibacillus sp. Soil766 TaxID=1736404 RepID=UPI000709DDD5|nr:hypothetical protein [Paenibacillus sp. Soil766]KRE96666.1 hypothetical protein ASG89_30845 [Paenibacillus sp. Soil766]